MSLNTDKSASVTDALNSRITVRQFLDKPVPDDVLNNFLRAPVPPRSRGTTQARRVLVVIS